MAQIDLHTRMLAAPALNQQTISTDTTTNGIIIDTAGYQSVEFVLFTGTITTGIFTPLLQHGDNASLADAANVPTDYLLGTYAGATIAATDDNACKQIGYVGKKRYVRLSIVTTSTGNGVIGAVAIKGSPATANINA